MRVNECVIVSPPFPLPFKRGSGHKTKIGLLSSLLLYRSKKYI